MKTLTLAVLLFTSFCGAALAEECANRSRLGDENFLQPVDCREQCVSYVAPYYDPVCGGARNLGQCISMDQMFGCVWLCQ